jgi:anti-sigma-K factor RskA
VTTGHDDIEELLAGYVLRSLSGEDASRADQLLSDHVPTCAACRDTLAVFQSVTADLALGTGPIEPPDTLLPRLRRDLGPQGIRRRSMGALAVAAGVIAVVGLAGLSVTQGMRVNSARNSLNDISAALDFARQPGASMASVDGATSDTEPLTEISDPGVEEFYLVGRNLPSPPPGEVYRIWLVSNSTPTFVGDFTPDPGFTIVKMAFDPSRYDEILISVEREGSEHDTPSNAVWEAAS